MGRFRVYGLRGISLCLNPIVSKSPKNCLANSTSKRILAWSERNRAAYARLPAQNSPHGIVDRGIDCYEIDISVVTLFLRWKIGERK